MNKKITIMLIALMSFMSESSGAASAAEAGLKHAAKFTDNQIVVRELNYKNKKEIKEAKEVFINGWVEFYKKESKKPDCDPMFLQDEHEMKEGYEEDFDEFIEDKEENFNDRLHVFVAIHKEKIVGVILADLLNGYFYVSEMVVRPDYQGRGVGALFLKKLEQIILENFLEIKAMLLRAISSELGIFYDKQGFKPLAANFKDYEDEWIATNFWKQIRADSKNNLSK